MRHSSLLRPVPSILVLLLVLGGCGPEASTDAGPGDSGPPPDCTGLSPIASGDDGHAEPLMAPAGQSRAGRLAESAVPVDRTGLGVFAAGDFVIANDRYALIIEDAGTSDLYDPYGGRPVGVAAVEGGALVSAGDFNEMIFGFGGYLVVTEEVSVIADGSDGGPAIIRASGPMGPLEFAGDLITSLVRTDDFTGLPAAMEYEMAPGSDAVDFYLVLQQNDPELGTARTPMMLTAFFQRYRMPIWTEAGGFVVPSVGVPMAAFVDDGGTSYAWFAPEGAELSPVLDVSGVLAFSAGRGFVEVCSEERLHLGTMLLGGPGLGGLQGSLARERGDTLRTVSGTVREADGTPASDVRVHVARADGAHFARLDPAEDGTFSIDVPQEAVSVSVFRQGTAIVGPVAVAADASTADVDLPAVGIIRVTVTNASPEPAPIPARVQVLPMAGAPALPEALGERGVGEGRAHVAFTTTGAVDLRVDPGAHEIVISRGFEYELHTEAVTVAAGEIVEVSAALDRVVDTAGIMCADYHIHTHRSPDSPDSPQLKLMGAIADGLEIPVRTDHEWINDFAPVIEELGLSPFAYGIGGEELTTFAYGHFGVFPVTEDRSRPSGGAIPWVGRLPPAVFADVRARPEQPVLIINHPRSGGSPGGYFHAAAFDRTTGTAVNPEMWDEEFTLVEVLNDKSFEQARDTEVADWLAFLTHGRRVFAVGSSDSHNIYGSPVGYPRTCLALGTDDPTALTDEMVRDVTAAGHSTISGGIYLGVSGPGGAGPGDEVSGAGAMASFELTVQAASWIMGELTLEVVVDGETAETIPITEADRDMMNPVIRLAETIEVPVAATGSFVIFHVRSDVDLAPVHPGRDAFAVSNPVFLTR